MLYKMTKADAPAGESILDQDEESRHHLLQLKPSEAIYAHEHKLNSLKPKTTL